MSRSFFILLGLIIMMPLSAATATCYMDAQVVCRLEPEADPDTVAASLGAVVIDRLDEAHTYLFSFVRHDPMETLVSDVDANPAVEYAQPNYVVNILDLLQVSQPFVDQTSQPFVDGASPSKFYRQYTDDKMMIDSAHTTGLTGEGLVIAVVDCGLDITHPLFEGRLHSAAIDYVDNDYEPWVTFGSAADHGTFVAGIITRSAPDASLLIVRSFSSAGGGTSFNIARGIYYAVNNGAQVINMSFGMDKEDLIIGEAINFGHFFGVVMTAAAGNSNLQYDRFPAHHPFVMSVAAVDSSDIKADFSNYSPTVAVAAPGVEVYGPLCGGDVWGTWCGTSFSTPYVSGLSGLVRSAYPEQPPEWIWTRIAEMSVDINGLNPLYASLLGSGRIHFYNATYILGDVNRSGDVNLGDAVYIINYIFRNGLPPMPIDVGDTNCDKAVNVGDAVYMINYIFNNGPPPDCL